MPAYSGTVRWFNTAKGFGFLAPSSGGPDLFCHYTSIANGGYRKLLEGEPVEFDIDLTPRGPRAINVVRLNQPPSDRSPGRMLQ